MSLYTSKTLGQYRVTGQSGSRVTGVPGRVGSRVSVTDPVPSLEHSVIDDGVALISVDVPIRKMAAKYLECCKIF